MAFASREGFLFENQVRDVETNASSVVLDVKTVLLVADVIAAARAIGAAPTSEQTAALNAAVAALDEEANRAEGESR